MCRRVGGEMKIEQVYGKPKEVLYINRVEHIAFSVTFSIKISFYSKLTAKFTFRSH